MSPAMRIKAKITAKAQWSLAQRCAAVRGELRVLENGLGAWGWLGVVGFGLSDVEVVEGLLGGLGK